VLVIALFDFVGCGLTCFVVFCVALYYNSVVLFCWVFIVFMLKFSFNLMFEFSDFDLVVCGVFMFP